MNEVISAYWHLMRMALSLNHPEDLEYQWSSDCDYASVIHLAMRQGTGALVANQLLSLHKEGKISLDSTFLSTLKTLTMQNMMNYSRMLGVLRAALSALDKGGVQPLLMKGFALARYYREPYLRTWGDIDLYVGKEGYHPTATILRNTFPDCPHFEEELEHFKHWNINVGPIPIEAHRTTVAFKHPHDVRLWEKIQQPGEMGQIEDIQVRFLEQNFNLLFVFVHSFQHLLGETASMKQLADLALLLHHEHHSISVERLGRWLKSLKLVHVWQMYAYILVTYFGLPSEECPFFSIHVQTDAERLYDLIMSGKPLHDSLPLRPTPTNMLLRKWHTFRQRFHEAEDIAIIDRTYARHMLWAQILDSLGRMSRGEFSRRWE